MTATRNDNARRAPGEVGTAEQHPDADHTGNVTGPNITNAAFIRAVRGELSTGEHLWTTGFPIDPLKAGGAEWKGRAGYPGAKLRTDPANNAYFSVAVLTGGRRQRDNFARLMALVADDADPAKLTRRPSWVLRTSEQKVQIGFILHDDDPTTRDPAACSAAVDAMVRAGLIGADRSGNNIVRYVRLPVGTNTKSKYARPFKHELTEWRPEVRLSLAEALAGFGVAVASTPTDTHASTEARPALDVDLGVARELALAAARHTHANTGSSRHAAVLGLGGDLCRWGLPADDALFDSALGVFEENMRDTDSAGYDVGLDWPNESAAVRAGYDAADRAGEHGSRCEDGAFDDLGELGDDEKPRRRFTLPAAIGADEWTIARSTPDCIVSNYLWSDVGTMIAPGGVGKTTLQLFEAVHIALGLPLYGLTVRRPGPVLLVSAEDSREMLVARLRDIAAAMWLPPADLARLRDRVRIADLSGAGFKLTRVAGDVVEPARGVDDLIAACRAHPPVLIVIDPAVSFGVGEARVNDAEQGLIEAGRRIRNALNCCVRFIHHSGKANAREKTLDQYSGRGGSAFADGSRMVAVLAALDAAEFHKATGRPLVDGESAVVLARPKSTYSPPQPPFFIIRKGYTFSTVNALPTAAPSLDVHVDRVVGLVVGELAAGRYPTKKSLEALATSAGIKRQDVRDAISVTLASGRLEERERRQPGRGGAHKYLHAEDSECSGGISANQTQDSDAI